MPLMSSELCPNKTLKSIDVNIYSCLFIIPILFFHSIFTHLGQKAMMGRRLCKVVPLDVIFLRNGSSAGDSGMRSPVSGERGKKPGKDKQAASCSHRQSNFVDRAQTYDYWTRCGDTTIEKEFQRAKLLLMVDKHPALQLDSAQPTSKSFRLKFFDCQDLRQKLIPYGLDVGTLNSALLDIHMEDEMDDYKAIFGASIQLNQPPEESGISSESQLEVLAKELGIKFMPLRQTMLTMDDPGQRELLAKFQIITRWYHLFVHCPHCTSLLKMKASKFSAQCPRCDQEFYPNVSPVVITLVRDEPNESALLVRHKGTSGVFTCIAGFCSPGESLEQTVCREVAEEVGIECWDVRVLNGSQSWPLPTGSLMIPFVATASKSDKIHTSIAELDFAKWFSREQITSALRHTENDPLMVKLRRHLTASGKDSEERHQLRFIPPQGAIAHQIIKNWINRKF